MNSELLDGILRQNHSRSIKCCVRIDQTIESVIIRGWAATINADGVAFTLAHLTLFPIGLNRARANEQQTYEIAAVQR